MKILITGVYGIVGSYLCEKLKEKHEVVGIGRREKYEECPKYYSCDITDKSQLEEIIKENTDLDLIIHCAALAHNKGDDLSKDRFMKVNYEATKYLVDLTNEYLKLENFIFMSTISVYGERMEKNIYCEGDKCYPKSPYAVAKRESEEYIMKHYSGDYRKTYSILRLAPVYSDDFRLNIDRRTLIKGIPYKVGRGKNKLSLCNIELINRVVNHIIEIEWMRGKRIYNIADRDVYDYNDLLKMENRKAKIIFPKFAFKLLYYINKKFMKKQFIHENTIKLVSNNIYISDKIHFEMF